jgi:hypothetical protein
MYAGLGAGVVACTCPIFPTCFSLNVQMADFALQVSLCLKNTPLMATPAIRSYRHSSLHSCTSISLSRQFFFSLSDLFHQLRLRSSIPRNSMYYSAVKPKPNPEVDQNLRYKCQSIKKKIYTTPRRFILRHARLIVCVPALFIVLQIAHIARTGCSLSTKKIEKRAWHFMPIAGLLSLVIRRVLLMGWRGPGDSEDQQVSFFFVFRPSLKNNDFNSLNYGL